MRYLILLVLGMTAFVSHAQSVNNPHPETAAVNPKSNSSTSHSDENNLLG